MMMGRSKLGNRKWGSRGMNYGEKGGEEKSGLNCDVDYGKWGFKESRGLQGKENGVEGDRVIECFKGGEVRGEECNELGLEVGEKIGGNDEVGMYRDRDREDVENDIVIN